MLWLVTAVVLSVSPPAAVGALSDPFLSTAEYYFSRHDYKQALDLWSQVLKRHPTDLTALSRVAELKVMFEGRSAGRAILVSFYQKQAGDLSPEERRALRDQVGTIASLFVTDEGQSLYLQAAQKIRASDWGGAAALLSQAAVLEKGNIKILKERAHCEKRLGALEKYYAILESGLASDPFDPEVVEQLAEAHVRFKHPEKTMALFGKGADAPKTAREKAALGIALVDAGEGLRAISGLQELIAQEKGMVHPVVYQALGTALAARPQFHAEAISYLDRFLIASNRPESAMVDGWDPFQAQERVESARKLLKELREE